MMVACILFASLGDIIGRKRTILLITIPGIASWILKAVARDVTLFYISRVLVGFHAGCYFALIPMYIGEISDPNIRGVLGSSVTAFNFFGQFLVTVLGNYFSVVTTSYIGLPLPIIFCLLFLFVPESPYYYIMKGKTEEAKRALWKLTRKENIETDFSNLKKDVERQMSERGTWKDLIMIPSNRKAILVGAFLRTSQFMGGMSVFVSSIQFIFEKSPGNFPAGISAMVYSFITFLSLFTASTIIDRIGRKVAYTVSLILGAIMLLLESLYFYLAQNLNKDLSSFDWFPLGGMVLFIIVSACGVGILPSLMMSEIFSASIKAKANILMVFLLALISTIASSIFFQMFPLTGLSGPFLFFGIMNVISATTSYLYLPETKGKTLEQIQQMFKGEQ